VAHCGTDIERGYLYTLTLTDVATGWTECLPLLHRSQEAVLAALQRARTLFPFPILGIDTDNGGEFINDTVIAYCEQEQITFTRGRPHLKNDQCFVEQKNGAIVRQVVGYDRFVGKHAYRQLTELYQALRLYVNCFQPSMKLLSKQRDGKKVRYVYDPAKTPLQRFLQSGVLPVQRQQEQAEVVQALDPIRLFQQLEQLQQAVFRCAVGCSPFISSPLSDPLHVFLVEQCTAGKLPAERSTPDPTAGLETLYREQERRKRVLGWRRTHKDPFEGEWEQIMSWVIANPERSSGDIFRELQRNSPGRYHPLQIRTLQRGMRKIRAYLLETVDEHWQEEVIRGPFPSPVSAEGPAEYPDRFQLSKPPG
jgi:integrase-like protein